MFSFKSSLLIKALFPLLQVVLDSAAMVVPFWQVFLAMNWVDVSDVLIFLLAGG